MKRIVIITLALGLAIVLGWSVVTRTVRAQSIETAEQDLARTEGALRDTASKTNQQAKTLHDHLATTDDRVIPADVTEFLKTTRRLERLRDELREDITRLDAATKHTLARFDQERAAITDPITRTAMRALRTQARQEASERLAQAQEALDQLGRVLVQGNDVAHAARCVMLAEELNTTSTALNEHLRRATEQATAYTTMTNDLLGRLTSDSTE